MKNTRTQYAYQTIRMISTFLFLLAICSSCTKENPEKINVEIPVENKPPKTILNTKSFQLQSLRQEIISPFSSSKIITTYDFQYLENGNINSIVVTNSLGQTSKKTIVYRTGVRIDSIVIVPDKGLDNAFKDILYKGNKITSANLYNSRAYGIFYGYPFNFNYDKKGNLLNSDPFDGFIYAEDGILTQSINKLNPNFKETYTYEYTINPLFMENMFMIFVYQDYFLKQFTLCKWNVLSKTNDKGVKIVYNNEYDNLGRIIRKSYTERDEKFELHFVYK